MTKERLDIILVNRKLVESRERAKRLIMAGQVFSKQERLTKPGVKLNIDIPIEIKEKLKYVSRGGLKLEKALNTFKVNVKNKTVVDVGSSTGGFTDCALQNGAQLVYAIDVGYNQLAWSIRSNDKVIVHERTNFRYVTEDLFKQGLPNFAVTDVSFISLSLIFPVFKEILHEESDIVALIKPQFEANREDVGKKGIIKDKKLHENIVLNTVQDLEMLGFECVDLSYSPITGGEGNIEFISHFRLSNNNKIKVSKLFVNDIVTTAHDHLKNKE